MDTGALRLVEQVGLEVLNPDLRAVLAKRGAIVDGERVCLPAELVRWALATVPRSFMLYGRDGREYPVTPGRSYLFGLWRCAVSHRLWSAGTAAVDQARRGQLCEPGRCCALR